MVTIIDVAKMAGVSATTVSHVINKTRFVEDITKKKVLHAIKELDYYPNIIAKSLQTGKSYTVGLIVSDITNPYFPEIVRGVEIEAIKKGYDIFLSNTDYNLKKRSSIVKRLIEKKMDGAIIMTLETDNSLVSYIASKKIPVVLLDWGIVDYYISNIKEDYEKGIEEAITYLIEMGHKNLAFISGPLNFKTLNNRKEALISVFKKFSGNINSPFIVEGDLKVTGGEAAAEQILRLPEIPTAIISVNDLMAMGVIRRIIDEGLKVPEDISVIGFNDIMLSSFFEPPLSTIGIPRYMIGQTAWKMLYKLMNSKDKMGTEQIIDTYFVARETTGKVSV